MMSVKKTIRGIFFSFLFVILFDIIYTVLGLFVISIINIIIVSAVIVITLLCGLFYLAYMIGAKLFSEVKIKVVSIVIIPMILLLLIFCISIFEIPILCLMMQYPAVILLEPLGIGRQFVDNSILIYSIVFLYHLMCCLSLLIGSNRKKHTQ